MVTPFAADGSVDLDAVQKVATYLVDNGNDGLVVSGTTGEAPTTTIEEDGEILRAVIAAVGDRASVVAGIGTNDTRHSIQLNQQAQKVGADGVLLVTPYYNRPTQDGLVAHFQAVAAAGDLPIMLYDIPARAGTTIAPETYALVAADKKFVAVKDAVGNLFRGVKIMRETGLAFYSGDDVMNLGWLTHGGVGIASVVAHVAGNRYAEMAACVEKGDVPGALAIYGDLAPLVDVVMNRVQGVMTAKAGLQLLGVLSNRAVRLPLVQADDATVDALREAMTTAGLLS
jgi:4-hydroxy-tetrahydrodipicolinate synthase